jgi:uncharacterized membrane protein YhaH (DUF805 family)
MRMIGGNLDWTELFFSSAGRLARGPFLVAAAVLIGLTALFEAVVFGPWHWLFGVFFYPLVLFCGACVLSKRLHDRGRTGWWAGLVLLAAIAVWPRPIGFFDFLFCIVLVWAVVDLGIMPGEQGANRFGASPLRPIQA